MSFVGSFELNTNGRVALKINAVPTARNYKLDGRTNSDTFTSDSFTASKPPVIFIKLCIALLFNMEAAIIELYPPLTIRNVHPFKHSKHNSRHRLISAVFRYRKGTLHKKRAYAIAGSFLL